MQISRFQITLKVLLGYAAVVILAIVAGWYLYAETKKFLSLQNASLADQNKAFFISGLLSQLYENESYARLAVRAKDNEAFDSFLAQNERLITKTDSLKLIVTDTNQIALIDSTKALLRKKATNFKELRTIYTNNNADFYLKSAIEKLSDIESALGKVNVEDFRKNPEKLTSRERALMNEIVSLLNKNRPPSSTRKLDEKTIDSIVVATKQLLTRVKNDAATQQEILSSAENALWENDNIISGQIQLILNSLETNIYENYAQLAKKRDYLLRQNITLLSLTAIVGVFVALIFSFLVLQDFFESQKLRKKLEKSNKRTVDLLQNREQLLATVSHDLRSPLSGILGYTDLLNQTSLSKKQAYYAGNIKQSADYVHKLANDLLDFSRLENQKIVLVKNRFSIRQTLEELTENIRPMLASKAVDLSFEITEEVPPILLGDAFRIKQILSNLLGNACKFTEAGYVRVFVQTKHKNEKQSLLEISVSDTGIGMDAHTQTQIFREFTQAKGVEEKFGGAGLGLTISKRLTELMQGTLMLESKPGRGSTFTLSIPLEIPKENQNTSKSSETKTSNPRIVVVDDDAALLQLTTEILKGHHFDMVSFQNAEKALNFLKQNRFDALITDIEMPEKSGWDLVKIIQKDKLYAYKNQPLIAITGRVDVPEEKYLEAGFHRVLYKPFSSENLLLLLQPYFPSIKSSTKTSKKMRVLPRKNNLFSLQKLHSFLQDDTAVKEVLQIFLTETASNMNKLQESLETKNPEALQQTSHKMLPMFKQLDAAEAVAILTAFESKDPPVSETDCLQKFEELKTLVQEICQAIQKVTEKT
ncbi:MAG: ATP-binding protein [Flavobacteriaceae bacterium]|nr:ATP-binding protein [Flavobacteriaceae bacterium]